MKQQPHPGDCQRRLLHQKTHQLGGSLGALPRDICILHFHMISLSILPSTFHMLEMIESVSPPTDFLPATCAGSQQFLGIALGSRFHFIGLPAASYNPSAPWPANDLTFPQKPSCLFLSLGTICPPFLPSSRIGPLGARALPCASLPAAHCGSWQLDLRLHLHRPDSGPKGIRCHLHYLLQSSSRITRFLRFNPIALQWSTFGAQSL